MQQNQNQTQTYNFNLANVLGTETMVDNLLNSSEIISFPSMEIMSDASKNFSSDLVSSKEASSLLNSQDPNVIQSLRAKISSLVLDTNVSYVKLKNDAYENIKAKQVEQSNLLVALQNDPQFIQKMASKTVPNPTGSNYVTFPLAPVDQNIPTKVAGKPQNGHPKDNITIVSKVEAHTRDATGKAKKKKSKTPVQEEPADPTQPYKKLTNLINTAFSNDKENDPSMQENVARFTSSLLNHLYIEVSKLKTTNILDKAPMELLQRLLGMLEPEIFSGIDAQITDSTSGELNKVICAMDACLITLTIMTTDNVSTSILKEDTIEKMLELIKSQLNLNVYPHYDAAAIDDANTIEESSNDKKKKTQAKKSAAAPILLTKISDILSKLHTFIENNHNFNDNMILKITGFTLPVFFVEGLSNLQLNALLVIRSIFNHYKQQRDNILDDIFDSLSKLPKTKRNLRTFTISEDKRSIQMVSALVLQLIQCCTSLSISKTESVHLDDAVNNYESSIACSKSFVSRFIRRCSSKLHENDYKHILENFVDDLLSVLNLPEWPAAETLLQILATSLVATLKSTDQNTGIKHLSIELLGSIIAKIRQESMASEIPTPAKELENTSEEREGVDCVCKKPYRHGEFCIDCDSCHRWYHGDCMGVIEDNVPSVWYCPNCKVRNYAKEQYVAATQNKDVELENSIIFKQMILSYLDDKSRLDPSVTHSRQFYISMWYNDDTNDAENRPYYVAQWGIDSKAPKLYIPRHEVIQAARHLSYGRTFSKSFDTLLKHLVAVLSDNSAQCRSRAMKALAHLLSIDSSLLADTNVQTAVHNRFLDASISVREATIDLVGKYVISNPTFVKQYFTIISDRILDTGISVRKRVIKILGEIALAQPNNPITPQICTKLVTRINDDESIKELILKTFKELWFNERLSSYKQTAEGGPYDVPARTRIIMAVVAAVSNHEWLIDLLVQLLNNEKETNSNSVYNMCTQMCKSLIEFLLSAEEKRAAETTKEGKEQAGQKIIVCTQTLTFFCAVNPEFLVPHVSTLHPYLKTPSGAKEDELTVQHIVTILEQSIPLVENPSSEFLSQLEKDLESAIRTHGMMVIQTCVKCLCTVVSKVTHNTKLLDQILEKFLLNLFQNKKVPTPDLRVVIRALFVLGLLCRYHEYGKPDESNFTEQMKTFLKQGELVDRLYSLFDQFLSTENIEIKVRAIQAQGLLFLRKPKLLLQAKDQINKYLDVNAHPRIKVQALRNFSDLLIEEDKRMKKNSKESKENKEAPDIQAEHTELGGGLLQLFITGILNLTFDKDPTVRLNALSAISLIIRHGLVNPYDCTPHLVALATDHVISVSEKAQKILVMFEEKHSGALHNRLLDGIKLSYTFQINLFNFAKAFTNTAPVEPTLTRLYTMFTPKKRQNFLALLLRLFEDEKQHEPGFLRYIAELISSLPFSNEEEPISVVNMLNRMIPMHSTAVLKAIKPVFKQKKVTMKSLEEIMDQCKQMPLQLVMLILKRSIKQFYSLTDNKCLTYSASAAKAEKGAPKTYDTVVFDYKTSPFYIVTKDYPQTLEQWKNQFEMFRDMMKSEKTVEDFNINEALPTKGKRKRKTETGETTASKARKPKKTKAKKKTSKKTEEEEEEESELEDEGMEDYE